MNTGKTRIAPLLILPVIWGSYYVASQRLVGYTSVFTSGVAIRFLTMIFLTVIMWKRRELPLLLQTHGVLKRLLLIGTLGFLLDLTAFIGLSMSSAASGTALLKCDVLMVNILSMIIYKQKFTWKAWACTLVMLFGVFLVMGIDFTNFQIGDPGNIFFLLSAFFVSLNAFVIKSVQLDEHNPVCDDVVAYYNNFVTMIYFIGTALAMGTLGQLGNLVTDRAAGLSWLLAALGQTGIYVVYYYNLRNYEVWLVKTFLLLMPIVSTIITFVLFGERMVFSQYLGMAVVMTGAFGILLEQKHQ
ncbi:MAG: DMT family transporter [Clostridiales bacterium]|nr:DMT family transporter [Clostridiales bacterium]